MGGVKFQVLLFFKNFLLKSTVIKDFLCVFGIQIKKNLKTGYFCEFF